MKIWRPYTQMKCGPPAVKLKSALGAFLLSEDGRKIFDGISSWWLITHGHCNPLIVEAVSKQACRLEQVVFGNFTHEAAEEVSERIGRLLPPSLSRLFFSDNGSTAVESAMKMALQFWAQTGQPQKTKFLAFSHSYHGDTCGAMSVSGESAFTNPYKKMRFEVLRAKQGLYAEDPIESWTGHFRKMIESNAEEVCAVIIEPLVQGAGGMIVWPVQAVQEICRLSREHNVLLIFDEVMTGFGRTGSLFAFEKVGVTPDILCLSKGLTGGFLPMGVTVASEKIYEAFLSERAEKMFFHGHSFTGNALSCAAAAANLSLFEDPAILNRVQELQTVHADCLRQIQNNLPVKEVWSLGAIGGFELQTDMSYGAPITTAIQMTALELGVFLRPLGNRFYLMPPYCTANDELVEAWKIVEESMHAFLG